MSSACARRHSCSGDMHTGWQHLGAANLSAQVLRSAAEPALVRGAYLACGVPAAFSTL